MFFNHDMLKFDRDTVCEEMNFEEAYQYIEHLPVFTQEGVNTGKIKYNLEGIGELLRRIGNPERVLKIIHISGTNGKGSVGTYLRNIMTASGYKVGHFSSPELIRFDEQICIYGKSIEEKDTAEILTFLKQIAEEIMADNLSYPSKFELIMALALTYFKEEACDYVIFECGLGGTNDATNIIETPELAVITGIDFDHTSILGNTLGEIASHKAGIIKPGGMVISAAQDNEAREVLIARAGKVGAELHFAIEEPEIIERSLEGQIFKLKGFTQSLNTRLLGTYQIKNAMLAIRAAEILREKAAVIREENIREGILETSYPCRFELISKKPYIIVDGAHNEAGVRSLIDSIKAYFPGEKAVMIAGVLADKEYMKMLDLISQHSKYLVATSPRSIRALPASKLAEAALMKGIEAVPCVNYEEALNKALRKAGEDGLICVFGSLYFVGLIRELMVREEGRDNG